MTRQLFMAEVRRLRADADAMERGGPGCANCEHFDGRDRRCTHFGAVVPADYAGADCPAYEFDIVPF